MKKKTTLILILAIIISTLMIPTKTTNARVETEITQIIQDGWVDNANNRDNTSLYIFNGVTERGFVEFNISEIPDTAIIDGVRFRYTAYVQVAGQIQFKNVSLVLRPSQMPDNAANNAWIYANVTAAATYAIGVTPVAANGTYIQDLGATGVWGVQNLLANDYYVVFMLANPDQRIWSNESVALGYNPVLLVDWHLATDFEYQFSDTYYENGTLYVPPVNVTVSGPGFIEMFNTSGGSSEYYPVEPTLFYWGITDGTSTASRRIHSIGSENITVTVPDGLFDTFVFTVRDFTKKLSLGDAYLEAYRIINGTETLIERQIIDVHNEVPLNLVIGATYTIRVRFYDGSYYDWGTFVPGDSATFTIVLRGVEFSDRAYQVSNFITVEIDRPTGTTFTVDYATTQNTTVWANITIQIRNGAIVAQVSRTNNSFTYNYAGALANTSYIVLIQGEHTLLREWGYTRIFDATETYPDIPDLETIFPLGLLNATNLIGWVLSVGAGGLTYSVNMKRGALIGMAVMASILTVLGFTDWSYYLLAIIWFFAVIVYIGSSEKT